MLRYSRLSAEKTTAITTVGAFLFSQQVAYALPQDGQVAAGSAAIVTGPGTLEIEQSSNRAVLNWSSFDIATGETVNFSQPGVRVPHPHPRKRLQGALKEASVGRHEWKWVLIDNRGVGLADQEIGEPCPAIEDHYDFLQCAERNHLLGERFLARSYSRACVV
jgi:hypothetical protein